MALMDSIRAWFSMTSGFDPPAVETRAVPDASLAGFIARIQGSRTQAWRTATTDDALGVPAIFSAVTLISNAMGSMSLRAYQKGRELPDDERPRIIIRPNPFSIPRDFFRDTAYSMAVYGEAWWWVAARDFDGLPLSLIPVNPREIQVTENPNDLRYPVVEWRNRRMPREDMKQITYLRDPGALRGFGPLQKCGAAVSVAVEAQEFAANFYADGGVPSIGIKTAYSISGDKDLTDEEAQSEADKLRDQWMSKPHNTPRVYGPDIEEIQEFGQNSEGAQMLAARAYNDINAAQLFNVPAPMIEAAVAGQNLTYQNIPDLYDSFARRCLAPNYAEPIEQTMSDLLTRQIVARHNFEALLRVDLKTRWEVYEIASRVIGPDDAGSMARRKEGIEPGDVEFAPMPASVPAAIPASLPIQGRSEVRCDGLRTLNGKQATCGKLLSTSGEFVGMCPRCKKNHAAVETRALEPIQVIAPQQDLWPFVEAIRDLTLSVRTAQMPGPTFAEGAITVQAPDMSPFAGLSEALVQLSTREQPAPQVTFEDGAIRGGDTHIATPDVRVEIHPSEITVEQPSITVEASVIPAPEVHIEPVSVNVAPTPVTVNVPEQRLIETEVVRSGSAIVGTRQKFAKEN